LVNTREQEPGLGGRVICFWDKADIGDVSHRHHGRNVDRIEHTLEELAKELNTGLRDCCNSSPHDPGVAEVFLTKKGRPLRAVFFCCVVTHTTNVLS
jgi:hypothetical protein